MTILWAGSATALLNDIAARLGQSNRSLASHNI